MSTVKRTRLDTPAHAKAGHMDAITPEPVDERTYEATFDEPDPDEERRDELLGDFLERIGYARPVGSHRSDEHVVNQTWQMQTDRQERDARSKMRRAVFLSRQRVPDIIDDRLASPPLPRSPYVKQT